MPKLVSVVVRNGDLVKALRVFKKKVENSGHIKELRERKEYTKPTTKNRLIKDKAIRLNQLKVQKQKEADAKNKV